MKLASIERTRTATADFGDGEVLNLEYSAANLTPRLESELAEARTSSQMVSLVLTLVTGWDLMEGDGETVVPLTEDRLMDVPLIVLSTSVKAVANAIANSVRAEGNS